MPVREDFYRSRLRQKGQVTIPAEIRTKLGAHEGDEIVFFIDQKGRVVLQRARLIPPDQAWFWSERWQGMEHEVQEDAEAGRLLTFDSADDLTDYLDSETSDDAEDQD